MTARSTDSTLGHLTSASPTLDGAARHRWDVVAAGVCLLLLGLRLPLAAGASTATVVVLGLAPVWVPALRRAPGVGILLALALIAVPSGFVLSWTVGPTAGRDFDVRGAVEIALLVLTAVGGAGVLVWARTVLPLHRVALLLAVGLLVGEARGASGSLNPWKYSFSFPVTVLVLALLGRRHPWLSSGGLVVLAGVGVANDSRSYAAFCVLTAALVLWRARPGSPHGRLRVAGVIGAVVVTGYQLGTELLVSGYLGSALQQRSVEQVERAGSLLAGGRPEWAATRSLFLENPWGFGLGAVPTSVDLRTAKVGLDTVGISGDNGYVNRYMFGGGFKLHSVVADLWSAFGVLGIALGALLVVLVVRSLTAALAAGRPAPVVVFLCIVALWWLFFGPIHSNFYDIVLALGLAVPVRGEHDPG